MLPCEDENCAYETTIIGSGRGIFRIKEYCTKNKCCISDIDNCTYFEIPKTCDNCKHSFCQIYETGTIDDIEYYCKLQNNKIIYDDSNVYNVHYGDTDIPKCPIDKFESY
jgi:hypothetical protein